ncbi:hypothetical protein LEN26_007648 [Aphanomyces euteiches]|uniref:Copper transport protein n=1 Tax=Aphanomyces euteiches TaxID=100861 RepID=A0A6G0XK23_9STRA|nr:hypothetical protein Ae201684_004034 [Aphanomyces euteiches]KAH9084661.1 hypothetical protein Ae201684P_001901 [Aphanomyces euteiches]KAH9131726.1 hypothetical protein LEN26_007648 [Aphanomyces euteiches]KAH9144323.1 hypothetical protein AeRB84_011725 [Aphanomyces euteiches]
MRAAAAFLLLLVFTTSFCVVRSHSGQDLSETYCPICNMVVQESPKQLLRGSQSLYACEMAGHLNQLITNPKEFVRTVSPIAVLPEPYENSTVQCPVCQDTHMTHAVSWGPHGNQKVFACSEHHANEIMTNPSDFFIYNPENDTSVFCQGATTMYDGFESAVHGVCPRLLFHSWVLNSEAKYILSLIGILLMGVALEYWIEWQEKLHQRLLQRAHTATYDVDEDSLDAKLLPPIQIRTPSLPFWSKAVLATSYMGVMTLAYFIMLVVMSYETGFFIAAVSGIGLGFFFFRDVDQLSSVSNPDPCCST